MHETAYGSKIEQNITSSQLYTLTRLGLIRAAGFKWDPPSYSWTSKEEDISNALLAAGLPGEVSRDSVVAMIETIDPAPVTTQVGPGPVTWNT